MIRLLGLGAVVLVAGAAIYTSDQAHDAASAAAAQDRSGFIAVCHRGNLVRGYLILDERNGRNAERRAGIAIRDKVAGDLFPILDCERTYGNDGSDVPVDAARRERFIRQLRQR